MDNQVEDRAPPAPPSEMATSAASAAAYLKTLAHEGRLMILCHLGSGEKSVGELEDLLEIRQALSDRRWPSWFNREQMSCVNVPSFPGRSGCLCGCL